MVFLEPSQNISRNASINAKDIAKVDKVYVPRPPSKNGSVLLKKPLHDYTPAGKEMGASLV